MQKIYRRALSHTASAAFLIVGCTAGAAALNDQPAQFSGQRTGGEERMEFRDEIHQSVVLAPGAQVRVRTVAGPVSIETTDGNKAEVHIVRMARTQRELDCYRVDVEAAPARLHIEQVQFSDRPGCRSIEARQEVRLRLPRSANVELSGIAGQVAIGALEGRLRLSGIAGRTDLESVRSADISGIAGALALKFASRGPWNTSISGIAGPVDLAFQRGIDADLQVSGSMGGVRSLSPDIQVRSENSRHWVRVGSGGPRLSLSGIMGPVRVRRY